MSMGHIIKNNLKQTEEMIQPRGKRIPWNWTQDYTSSINQNEYILIDRRCLKQWIPKIKITLF